MRRRGTIQLLFILPAVAWVLCFTLFPLVYSVRLSFYNARVGEPEQFVGLANYATFLHDRRAWESLGVTLVFVACGVTVQLVLGMALALLFHRPLPGRGVLRTLLTAPLFATPIAVGFLFRTIFYEEGGLANGLLGTRIPWLSDPRWALASVLLVDIWQWTPFCFLIFLAALQGIPEDYYEAARLETRSGWTLFRCITLPILMPTVILVLLLRLTEAFKVLDIPYTLTGGGPGTSTQVLSLYAYFVGLRNLNFGYASCVSVVMLILVTGMILVLFRRMRQVYQ